ncbi:hypothetical protein AB0L53_57200 [Nonomuraea sp. NPDC052129]|uniref:hypothetical protein n=1 Tax=Nonomuraea sp. NPDC052129 TaxID=3154651 RepID=UPI00342E5AC2
MAMLRLLAIGLLSGVVAVPFWSVPRGDGFEHARFAVLTALGMGQFLTVPVGLAAGFVLAVMGSWTRPPGHVLGAITAAFGAIVATQAWPTMSWIDGRPSGLGDPDGESVIAFLAFASGAITILVGLSIVLIRWSGYDPQAAPVRQRGPRRYGRKRRSGRTSRRRLPHAEGHSP